MATPLFVGPKCSYFSEKYLCLLLIFDMLYGPYFVKFPGDLLLFLWEWEQVSYDHLCVHYNCSLVLTVDFHVSVPYLLDRACKWG